MNRIANSLDVFHLFSIHYFLYRIVNPVSSLEVGIELYFGLKYLREDMLHFFVGLFKVSYIFSFDFLLGGS